MLGNPVPSSLDWTLISRGDGIDNALYYYDASIQNYRYYIQLAPGISVSGGSQYIPPMQGFFVHANNTGTNKTVTIDNTMRKVSGLTTYYKEKSVPDNYLVLSVENELFRDEAYIIFFDQATAAYDGQYDALKLASLNPQVPLIYTVGSDNADLAINALPFSAPGTVIPLHFKAGTDGTYSVSASELGSFPVGTIITLEDLKTSHTQNLVQNPVYSFQAATSDEPGRFMLHFTGPFGIDDPQVKPDISIYSSGVDVYINSYRPISGGEVSVYNLLGQKLLTRHLKDQPVNIIPMNGKQGYYVVKVVTDRGTYTGKVYVQ
jgi:hypothetical protein